MESDYPPVRHAELVGHDTRVPWNPFDTALDTARVEALRRQTQQDLDDLDAAHALARLAHSELVEYGTKGAVRLSDDEITLVLRALQAVLRRIGVTFEVPFRDFSGFHTYWKKHGMGGSWAARRNYVNDLFNPIFERLEQLDDERTQAQSVRGVDGELRNLIFASAGPKPKIVLTDAVNNIIRVTDNAEYCLFYDRPLTQRGLTWG